MTLKNRLQNLVSRVAQVGAEQASQVLRDDRNIDLCLASLCGPELLAESRYPVALVDLIRTCIEPMKCTVREVKKWEGSKVPEVERFTTLLEVLQSSLPPMEFASASAIARVADGYRSLMQPYQSGGWSGDISLHFQMSSSFGKKGRILSTIVRLAGSERGIELGTAYGMSAMFILETIRANKKKGHLLTVEYAEPLYSLASGVLKARYGDMVSCHFGTIQDVPSDVAKAAEPIDFLFHDACHSGEAYVRDFNDVKDRLAPGSIVIIDDIRWEDLRLTYGEAVHCYEGWMTVCADPKVRRAVEIDDDIGVLLLY